MSRINVIEDGQLRGWFDDQKAQSFEGDTHWDGRNHIDVNTGCQWSTQTLWRSGGGKWILEEESHWGKCQTSYRFVGEEEVKDWLLRNKKDKTYTRFFGNIEEECGPADCSVSFRCTTEILPA